MMEISWELYTGKFLGIYMLENFWKLYAGNHLMKTICWKIQVDTSWENAIVPGAELSIPAPQAFLGQGDAPVMLQLYKCHCNQRMVN